MTHRMVHGCTGTGRPGGQPAVWLGLVLLLGLLLPAPMFAQVVGPNSCTGIGACGDNRGTIGTASCTGSAACGDNRGTVGTESCTAAFACGDNRGTVGTASLHCDLCLPRQ